MSDEKYVWVSDAPKVIRKLKKRQRYYFEIAYTEIDADDDDYDFIWVGKRSVVIKK